MLSIDVIGDKIILFYELDWGQSTDFVFKAMETNGYYPLKGVFIIAPENIKESENIDSEIEIVIGKLVNDYYEIDNKVIDTSPYRVFIHKSVSIRLEFFIAHYHISVLRKLAEICKQDIYIGFDIENELSERTSPATIIPLDVFKNLLKTFPNSTELKKYSYARIDKIMRDYLEISTDYLEDYEKYLSKKEIKKPSPAITVSKTIREGEYLKYTGLLNILKEMLVNEKSYSEEDWQSGILEILCLIYPQYIKSIPKVRLTDVENGTHREMDFILVSVTGTFDIVEIKKAYGVQIMTKNVYRDNYAASRELTGTVMQIEKYIQYLNKWGKGGERILNDRLKGQIPTNIELRICNPLGIIIMGRSNNLDSKQRRDYEIVKREYRNIAEIITYDELVERLERLIAKFEH